MILETAANYADVIGGIAVVVSLIYVGIKVNHGTSAIRSSAANDASVAMQSWYLEMGSNRQASDVWFNAMTSTNPLETHDEFQFMMMMHACLLGIQNSYLLTREGTLDEEFSAAITGALVGVKDLPGMDRYWSQRKGYFHSEFAGYVDDLLRQDAIKTLDMYKRATGGLDQ
jgi:hypothetical protein